MKSLFSLYTITYTKTYSENSKYKKGQLSLFLVGIVIIIIMTIIIKKKKTSFPHLIMMMIIIIIIINGHISCKLILLQGYIFI